MIFILVVLSKDDEMNCILCLLPISTNNGICSACYELLPVLNSCCNRCGLPLFNLKETCHHCLELKPNWDFLVSAFEYKKPLIHLIYQFKNGNKTEYAFAIAKMMFLAWFYARCKIGFDKPDIITCVPLHKKRMLSRGYNQSALISGIIASFIKVNHQPFLLSSKDKKQDQKKLSKEQRRLNTNQLFSVNSDLNQSIQGKTILLIDDIVTTGSTVNEASKQLKLKGAKNVQVLCLCRATL